MAKAKFEGVSQEAIDEVRAVQKHQESMRELERAKDEKRQELEEMLSNCPFRKMCPLREFAEAWVEKHFND